jgi:hypothetical protein
MSLSLSKKEMRCVPTEKSVFIVKRERDAGCFKKKQTQAKSVSSEEMREKFSFL